MLSDLAAPSLNSYCHQTTSLRPLGRIARTQEGGPLLWSRLHQLLMSGGSQPAGHGDRDSHSRASHSCAHRQNQLQPITAPDMPNSARREAGRNLTPPHWRAGPARVGGAIPV